MYYTYMLRCTDNTIYTGITTDVKRRMTEHFTQNEKCAKYTKRHKPKKLEAVWSSQNRKEASKLEYYLKHLSKHEKEDLIKNNINLNILADKIDVNEYRKIGIRRMFYG